MNCPSSVFVRLFSLHIFLNFFSALSKPTFSLKKNKRIYDEKALRKYSL